MQNIIYPPGGGYPLYMLNNTPPGVEIYSSQLAERRIISIIPVQGFGQCTIPVMRSIKRKTQSAHFTFANLPLNQFDKQYHALQKKKQKKPFGSF